MKGTIAASQIYGGTGNEVFPMPAPSPAEASGVSDVPDFTTVRVWLAILGILVALRVVYEVSPSA